MPSKISVQEKYDKIYSTDAKAFGGDPTQFVKDIPNHISSGTVLDLGAGQGRNSLFLAMHGFAVTAVDLSPVGIETIKSLALENNVTIDASIGDIASFKFERSYDVIIIVLSLHHLTRQQGVELLDQARAHTNPHGLNVIAAVTKDSDFYRDHPDIDQYYTNPGEMSALYKDWEVLDFKSKKWEALVKRTDGTPRLNTSEEILARKK